MEIKLELKIPDMGTQNERVFLNFWDSKHGKDVCCQIKDGKLYKFVYTADEVEQMEEDNIEHEPFEMKEITLSEFVELVKKRQHDTTN